jgi:CTP synthase
VLKANSKARQAYNDEVVSERHRHRFEFNNDYRAAFAEQGVVFSGLSPDGSLVEVMELTDHPWFVSCQFHPELKSKPMSPHPLFRELVRASLNFQQKRFT